MSNVNKIYEQYAAELGDIEFKLHLLQKRKTYLVQKIESLNELAESLKQGPSVKKETQGSEA